MILFYKVAKYLTKFCSTVLWKTKIVSDKCGYLAEKISRQKFEGLDWFSLAAYSDVKNER